MALSYITTPTSTNTNINFSDFNEYTNSYNNSVALLDDPYYLNQTAFDTYMYMQNKKINTLTNDLNNAKRQINTSAINVSKIKSIKNLQNSQILNVEEYPKPNLPIPTPTPTPSYTPSPSSTNQNPTSTQTPSPTPSLLSTNPMPSPTPSSTSTPTPYTTQSSTSQSSTYVGNNAAQYPNYLIYGNNGCLQYNNNPQQTQPSGATPQEPNKWSFVKCNSNDNKQQFYINKVNTIDDYNKYITNSFNQNYVINSANTTNFGFYVVNPANNSDQCLQLNNDGLSIEPCNMTPSQRFMTNYRNVL